VAEERTEAKSLTDALRCGGTFLTEDADVLIARDGVDVIVEATGNPAAGIQHALACFGHKRHIVMVNVEADVLAGRCWRAVPPRQTFPIPWPMATSQRSLPRWSTERARHAGQETRIRSFQSPLCRPGATTMIETSRGRHTQRG
jgi:hypothetical protein